MHKGGEERELRERGKEEEKERRHLPTPTPNGQPRETVGGYVIERLASMKQQNIGRSTLLLLVCLRIAYLLSCSEGNQRLARQTSCQFWSTGSC